MNASMLKDNPEQVFFSIKDGLFMPFIYKGHQVVLHQSTWTFRETIWVNDDVVDKGTGYDLLFTGMGYRTRSKRTITVAGDTLELTFGMRKWATEFFLEVRQGDELIIERSFTPNSSISGPTKWVTVLAFALAGMVFGYSVTWLVGNGAAGLLG